MKKGVNWSVVGAVILGILAIVMTCIGCVGCAA